jgi:hypothetical protein
MSITILLIIAAILSSNNLRANDKSGKSPLDELPPHIKQVTLFGQRADFSHDSKKILFLEKTLAMRMRSNWQPANSSL